MIDINLPADTKAILLLCGYFGGKDRDVQPLSLSEYNKLALWLRNEKLRPEDLLSREGEEQLATFAKGNVTPERLHRLLERGMELGFAVEEWSRQGLWVVSRGEEAYPRRLKKRLREAAPALLFGAGEQGLMDTVGLGMVGSRDADDRALDFTRQIGRQCSVEGITVVSGGARGVDQESMSAALEAGGTVIAVLAEGIARPAVSKQYRSHIADGRLVLVSPYHPGARWTTGNAMGRNKHVYALSDWTLVVSSGTDGGTWAGAVEDLKNGWAPLVVRLDAHVPEGNKKLVEKGAVPLRPESLSRAPSLLDYLRGISATVPSGNGTGDLFSSAMVPPRETAPQDASQQATDGVTEDEASQEIPRAPESAPPEASGEVHVAEPSPSLESPASPHRALEPAAPAIGDLFPIVWPVLARAFKEEVADSDLNGVAEQFNLQVGQLRAWVKQAVDERLLDKRTRPTRYILQ